MKSKSQDNMWTTFTKFRGKLRGKGYTNGFVQCNSRATNDYRNKQYLAYMVNRFYNPMLGGFFEEHDITIDNDAFALSEMVQWIWRSAIRDNQDIYIYVPSLRMRELLMDWLNN